MLFEKQQLNYKILFLQIRKMEFCKQKQFSKITRKVSPKKPQKRSLQGKKKEVRKERKKKKKKRKKQKESKNFIEIYGNLLLHNLSQKS